MRIFENNTTGEIVATSAEFETMSIGDTYDQFGQPVDADEVGEYDVVGYNYWNGHNWETIIIEDDCGYVEWEEITGDEAKKYLDAIDNKEEVSENWGVTTYRCGDLYFKFNQAASAWEDYRFVDDSEIAAE